MRNFNLFFASIIFICMTVVIWLSSPGNVESFRKSTLTDLLLHQKILPNLLIFLILLWIFLWFVIPREVKRLRIAPLLKLKPLKHVVGLSLIFLGSILQYLLIMLPESIKTSEEFPLASAVIIFALLVWWLATMVYATIPNDYKKGIMFILSFTMIFLTVLHSLTYFIKI